MPWVFRRCPTEAFALRILRESRFRDEGLEFRDWGLGFRDEGLECRVEGFLPNLEVPLVQSSKAFVPSRCRKAI